VKCQFHFIFICSIQNACNSNPNFDCRSLLFRFKLSTSSTYFHKTWHERFFIVFEGREPRTLQFHAITNHATCRAVSGSITVVGRHLCSSFASRTAEGQVSLLINGCRFFFFFFLQRGSRLTSVLCLC
jgi:hypothetical protein